MNISMKPKQAHRCGEQICGSQGGWAGAGRQWTESLGLGDADSNILEWIKQQGPTVQRRERYKLKFVLKSCNKP